MKLFKIKTPQGYIFKVLSELLLNIVTHIFLKIDENAIYLSMIDEQKKILVDFTLEKGNFTVYKFKSKQPLYIGINAKHLHKMLRSVKKKDSLMMFIDEKKEVLGITIIPKEHNRITNSYIKIQNVQNLNIEIPFNEKKTNPIIVPSNDFQKLCKDMNNIGSKIKISSEGHCVKFACNANNIYSREVIFGEINEDDSDDSDDDNQYEEVFDTDVMIRIIKIAGLSSQLQIYPVNGLPLLFKSNIGQLGKIRIFVKDNNLVQRSQNLQKSQSDSE